MENKFYLGNCLEENLKIKDGSVDLILTDLPFGNMRVTGLEVTQNKKERKHDWDFAIEPKLIYEIANRILRKNGKMILFSQEPYTTQLISSSIPNVPFCYRAIWEKDNFAVSLGVNRNMVSYFEDILIFSKKHDMEGIHPLRPYFKMVMEFIGKNKKAIVEKIGQSADHCFRVNSSQFSLCTEKTYTRLIDEYCIDKMNGFKPFAELVNETDGLLSTFNLWEGNKYKSNILKYNKDYDRYHPTQKPILLLEDLIKTFSNENDLVVDLTAGSGSTGIACYNTKRNYVMIEKEKQYFDLFLKREEKNILIKKDNEAQTSLWNTAIA